MPSDSEYKFIWTSSSKIFKYVNFGPSLSAADQHRSPFCGNVWDIVIRPFVQGCHQLTSINLRDNINIADNSLAAIADYCLIEIDVLGCFEVTDDGVNDLMLGCRQLTVISISSSTFDFFGGTALRCCVQQTRILLNYSDRVTDAAVINLAQNCGRLIFIDFCRFVNVPGASFSAQSQGCPLVAISISTVAEVSWIPIFQLWRKAALSWEKWV